jgi:hypothetical protein
MNFVEFIEKLSVHNISHYTYKFKSYFYINFNITQNLYRSWIRCVGQRLARLIRTWTSRWCGFFLVEHLNCITTLTEEIFIDNIAERYKTQFIFALHEGRSKISATNSVQTRFPHHCIFFWSAWMTKISKSSYIKECDQHINQD